MRLRRVGTKGKPFYRIVVADQRSPREGRFIENLGTFNPLANSNEVVLKTDRIKYWLEKGAEPSETVRNLLKKFYTSQ